jgi:hypothetical protein
LLGRGALCQAHGKEFCLNQVGPLSIIKEAFMQKWEYMTILRFRVWDTDKEVARAPWQKGVAWNIDIGKKLAELGEQGWELVTVTPRSSYLGGKESCVGGIALDYAGFTSEELWVFKRQKQ